MFRFHSFYGKLLIVLIIEIVIALYFLLFTNVFQGEDEAFNGTAQTAAPTVALQQQEKQLLSENDENEVKEELIRRQMEMPTYEMSIRLDLKKQVPGLGNKGEPVFLHGPAKERGAAIYKRIALNEEVSEHLPYTRTVPDGRHPACLKKNFDLKTLSTASVIITFFNEPYSVLVRTVHSILNTCHESLLKEIILVDDGSTNVELGGKLDYYISSRLPAGKINVIRLKNRLGLIRARLAGAHAATGDVLIFLDAHCECNIDWCEPLLYRIKESRTSVLVPIIDNIDPKDFEYTPMDFRCFKVGGFQWNGQFDWIEIPARERKRQLMECKDVREICPAYSPTMAGGLFAIDRHYFWEVGSYDEQMDGWGGENLEMSFRIWQCGGTIETIPCSRVGHVFRDFHPYEFANDRDTYATNAARMALVWMDDYLNFFFLHRPGLKFNPDIGDVTEREMLRKNLHCKSFDWYLKNVYPEKFVPTQDVIAYGRVKAKNGDLCLDDLLQNNEQPYNMGLFTCDKALSKSQFYSYTETKVLRNELSCATVKKDLVVMVPCMEQDENNEQWQYENHHLIHTSTGLCLDYRCLKSKDDARVTPCDPMSETQHWTIEHDFSVE